MYKILLCCSSGVTTNMLVNSMKETAKEMELEVMIWSVGETAIEQSWASADCILVAPQSASAFNQIKKLVAGSIPVEVISDECFSKIDGKGVLGLAISLIKE